MSKHTPGPWEKHMNLIKEPGGAVVATVARTQDGYVQANARLIAAAPDLLAVLKRVMVGVDERRVKIDAALGMMISDAVAKTEAGE